MKKNSNSQIFAIGVGGQAGDGVKEAATSLGKLAVRHGYEIFLTFEYPSLIKGGHNFAQLNFSVQPVRADAGMLDGLFALNSETVEKHKTELKKGAPIFLDLETKSAPPGVMAIPASVWTKEAKLPAIMRSSAMLGAACYYFGFQLEELNAIFTEAFGERAQPNILLAAKGYEYMETNKADKKTLPVYKALKKELRDGNEAFAEGLKAGGLKNYFAYPMTPSSTILHYLAKKSKDYGIKVVQPENEIAVINMALGAAYAGNRTAVGSAGGGFALMLEAMALAGVAELPIVVADAQRASTSTGVPTRTGQGDLDFVRHMPGEYPRVVIAPGDPEEAFLAGGQALNLAWKYQSPVVVLLDKHLSETLTTASLPRQKIKIESHKTAKAGAGYKRYAYAKDGVSPLAFPGLKNASIKVTSYEHDEDGFICEDPSTVKKMYDKRFAKEAGLLKEMKKLGGIKIFGDIKSKNIVVFFGSVKGPVLESARFAKKSFKALQVVWLEPFPEEMFMQAVKGAKKIVCVEQNFTGQLAKLIREKTGVHITRNIRQYDSLVISAEQLAAKLDKLF